MKKSKFIKSTGIAAVAMMLPMSQAVMAEGTWGISGWINEGISIYDDGHNSDMGQASDNGTTLGSRITLSGTYEPEDTGLKAGFEFILEPQNASSPLIFMNQADLDDNDLALDSDIGLLSHNIFVSGAFGKITIGQQSMPTDNIAVLADPSGTIFSDISPVFRYNGFSIMNSGASVGTWSGFLQCHTTPGLGIGIDCNGIYRNGVRYDLPAFGPVSVAVGWANDDIYDVAAKYAGEFGTVKVLFNAGYSYTPNGGAGNANAFGASDDFLDTLTAKIGAPAAVIDTLKGLQSTGDSTDLYQFQLGLMDSATGLFGTFAYTMEETDEAVSVASGSDDTDAYHIKVGIKQGMTAGYVTYAQYNDQYGALGLAGVSGSEMKRWGIGVEHALGARLNMYAKYEQYELDVSGTPAIEAIYDGSDDLELLTLGLVYFF